MQSLPELSGSLQQPPACLSGKEAYLLLFHEVLSLAFKFLLHEDCFWHPFWWGQWLQLVGHPMDLKIEPPLQNGAFI